MAFLSPFILSWRGLTGIRTRDERLIAHEDPLCLVVLLCKPVALLACNMAAEQVSMPIYEYAWSMQVKTVDAPEAEWQADLCSAQAPANKLTHSVSIDQGIGLFGTGAKSQVCTNLALVACLVFCDVWQKRNCC